MKKQELTDFEKELLESLKGQRFYCVIKSVSKSGMTRRMVFYFQFQNELYYLNDIIAKLTNYKKDKNGYLVVQGCGMDMVLHVLYLFNEDILYYKKTVEGINLESDATWFEPRNYRLL